MDQITALSDALDIEALASTPLAREPFEHVIVPGFLKKGALPAIHEAYPVTNGPGSFPYQALKIDPVFGSVIDALQGADMRAAVERVFGLDLAGRPTTVTVRGQCRDRDGKIHPDSAEKIITVLIYMNPPWEDSGGRLRLLRSADNIEDYAVEAPPDEGTLLAFRRSDTSFHGHKPFSGERRVIQLNWVTNVKYATRERRRHAVSAFFKRLTR